MKILFCLIIISFLFACNGNKILPTLSHNSIQSSQKKLQADNKSFGNLSILLFKESILDYTVCLNNQYIGVIGPHTKANLILSEGSHNLKLGIRETIDGTLNYENNPCGPRKYNPYHYINKNLNIYAGKNYIFDIQIDPSSLSMNSRYRLYFNEVPNNYQKISMFRPVINFIDPKIRTQNSSTNISKPKEIINNQISLSKAKKECADLGFKEKSEKFGECVMEFIK